MDAMAAAGLAPAKPLELIADEKIHRYRGPDDKAGKNNAWYVLHAGPPRFASFGTWKDPGAVHYWREASSKPLTHAERAGNQRRNQAMRDAHALEREAVHASARQKAAKLWATARPATNAHPYLQRKAVHAFGIRQLRDMLLIPARDVHGELHTLQFISADGSKRFLTGGKIAGCYFAIGKPRAMLLLAEGLSTGSTLHMATGEAVAVCFSCGNLLPVAKALRGKFPRMRLVVCADNDAHTAGNPGVTHARAAAKAVGGILVVPQFRGGV
jgi:putative DNA primase/helicase